MKQNLCGKMNIEEEFQDDCHNKLEIDFKNENEMAIKGK